MTYSYAKVQDQRSIGYEESGNKRTDGQTDGGDCITSLANAVFKIEHYAYINACKVKAEPNLGTFGLLGRKGPRKYSGQQFEH